MFASAITVALLGALAASVSAVYKTCDTCEPYIYNLTDFSAIDDFVLSPAHPPAHRISFNVSDPRAVAQRGGNFALGCILGWNTTNPPTCFTPCQVADSNPGTRYYLRVTPGTYSSAQRFQLDIQEYYHDFLKGEDAETFVNGLPFISGDDNYSCDVEAIGTRCIFNPDGYTTDIDVTFNVTMPDSVCEA